MLDRLFSRPRRVFAAMAVVCFGMLAFAVLYLQNIVGLTPCPMCIVQRDALILAGFCCVLAALSPRMNAWRVWGGIGTLVAVLGAFTAAKQSWLQWHPPEFASCGRDIYGIIETFPLSRAIPLIFKGSGDCAAVDWTFLGGSIANWSFVAFIVFIVVAVALLIKIRRPHGSQTLRAPLR